MQFEDELASVQAKVEYLNAVIQRLESIIDDLEFQGGKGGSAFEPEPVTVDLRGKLYGPFTGKGKYAVVDVASDTVTQSGEGAERPEEIPEHEVWIDLEKTVGRVYIPRLG